METPGSGHTIGAQELLDHYHSDQRAIAEAYIKGNLPEPLAPFVMQVIGNQDIDEARERLDRSVWRLEERVAKLEEEVKALQAKGRRPPSAKSPYEPQSLPGFFLR